MMFDRIIKSVFDTLSLATIIDLPQELDNKTQ